MSSASAFKQAAQTEDYAVSESKSLLQNQPDSSSVAHPPIVFGTVHSEEVIQAYDDSELPCWEAPMPELLKRPADLKEVPAAYDQWPGESIKVACPHCGVWMTTSIEAETECVGFRSLFSTGPLFRSIYSHYCPNCYDRVGLHYTVSMSRQVMWERNGLLHLALSAPCPRALGKSQLRHDSGLNKRRLELCYWPDQGALPAKGKEYPGLGYKRRRDKPPKAQQQQQPAAVSAASGVWDPQSGQLMADQLRRWKLTKGQVKHASGLNNARRDTERWLAPIKPHLQHLAAASSAGTSLEANLKHITVTLATWDAVWEVYLDPKWARQRLRLYGAQDRAGAVLQEGPGAQVSGRVVQGGRVVLVDEHRTSRVSSAVNGQQPCEEELNKLSATRPAGWKPPAGQVEPRLVRPAWSQERGQPVRGLMWCPVVAPRKPPQAPRSSQEATPTQPSKGKGKGKAAKAKPAPQPGRWLDRDCNAALNMQRIGESRWRPLELCYWPDQGALPAKGKEYPGLGYRRLRDKPPKAQQQQQQQPAGAHPYDAAAYNGQHYRLARWTFADLTATRAMAAQGAALQSQNNELVKCKQKTSTCGHGIDDLREKREEIIKQIKDDEQEKNKIQQDVGDPSTLATQHLILQILTKRLAQVNESIARKNETRCQSTCGTLHPPCILSTDSPTTA
ncbi:hypothetical protein QJQ45_014876 [Haematococcus lacustris]|nr:hypothetical protein QJQ45_014876 [Haematococcus lacustris]